MKKKVKYNRKKQYVRNFLYALLGFVVGLLVLNQFIDLNPSWNQPGVKTSENGLLTINLPITKTKVSIGGKESEENVYNGKYIDDTWIVKGGDTIKVNLKNNGDQPTNLHLHGFHVSPKGNSDNVLLNIKEGESFDYEYHMPKNHPPGLYWYHPHLHHYTDNQVMGGMLGAIIVKGDIDELPGIKGVSERLLVLTTQDQGNDVIRLVNNMKDPTMYIRPFETVRLRILNASSDDFYNFSIPEQKLNIISRDGNTLSKVQSVDSEVMAPGDRIEILFQAGLFGTYDVKSLTYNAGFVYPEDTFMKIQVFGLPVMPKELPTNLLSYKDLRDVPVANTRTLTFSEEQDGNNTKFLLDGKEFDPNVINQVMVLGTTEQWNIVNTSSDVHPFHIHINPFQVISVNGKPVERNGYDDTFPIPAHGSIVIKTQYKDYDGKYVLHCHILFHEDHGMMQLLEVVKPGFGIAKDNGVPLREGMPEMDHAKVKERPKAKRYKVSPTKAHTPH